MLVISCENTAKLTKQLPTSVWTCSNQIIYGMWSHVKDNIYIFNLNGWVPDKALTLALRWPTSIYDNNRNSKTYRLRIWWVKLSPLSQDNEQIWGCTKSNWCSGSGISALRRGACWSVSKTAITKGNAGRMRFLKNDELPNTPLPNKF